MTRIGTLREPFHRLETRHLHGESRLNRSMHFIQSPCEDASSHAGKSASDKRLRAIMSESTSPSSDR